MWKSIIFISEGAYYYFAYGLFFDIVLFLLYNAVKPRFFLIYILYTDIYIVNLEW